MTSSDVIYVDEDYESNDREGLEWSPSDFIYMHNWIKNDPPANIEELLGVISDEEFHKATKVAFLAWIKLIQKMHADEYGKNIPSARFQTDSERNDFTPAARKYLISAQHSGLIDQPLRERILAAALAFGLKKVTLGALQWITAIVLLCRPNQKTDLAWLKELVYDVRPSQLQ